MGFKRDHCDFSKFTWEISSKFLLIFRLKCSSFYSFSVHPRSCIYWYQSHVLSLFSNWICHLFYEYLFAPTVVWRVCSKYLTWINLSWIQLISTPESTNAINSFDKKFYFWVIIFVIVFTNSWENSLSSNCVFSMFLGSSIIWFFSFSKTFRWCLFFYLILNITLMINSVKY